MGLYNVNLYINRNQGSVAEFLRFCIVGGICTITDYLIFVVSSKFIPYQISVVFGFAVSFLLNYILTALWTFKVKPSRIRFLLMIICHILNMFIVRIGLLTMAIEILGVEKDIAYMSVLIISAFTSFLMMRFVFKRQRFIKP